MFGNKHFVFFGSARKKSVFFLAFFWIFGILSGYHLWPVFQEHSSALMIAAVASRVSIVGLLFVILVPGLLSATSVHFSKSWIIYLIACVKGTCFGFSVHALLYNYGSAAWLFYILVLFSDICMLIPLFLFWIRHVNGAKQRMSRDLLWYTVFAAIIGSIDYLWISPSLLLLH